MYRSQWALTKKKKNNKINVFFAFGLSVYTKSFRVIKLLALILIRCKIELNNNNLAECPY